MKLTSRNVRIALADALIASVLICFPSFVFADSPPSLGQASDYAVLGFSSVDMTVSSGNTQVIGNLGLGPGGTLDFSGGGLIDGNLYYNNGELASIHISGGSSVTGSISGLDMAVPVNAAIAASSAAAALSPDALFASVIGTQTISAVDSCTVLQVNGNIAMSGGEILTLNGSATDLFIINVLSTGTINFTGGSSIAFTGGMGPGNVLFNVIGLGQRVEFNGGSHMFGTFLAPDRDITVSGGTVNGALLGSGSQELKLQSGPHVTFVPMIPEPASLSLVILTALTLARRRRG